MPPMVGMYRGVPTVCLPWWVCTGVYPTLRLPGCVYTGRYLSLASLGVYIQGVHTLVCLSITRFTVGRYLRPTGLSAP